MLFFFWVCKAEWQEAPRYAENPCLTSSSRQHPIKPLPVPSVPLLFACLSACSDCKGARAGTYTEPAWGHHTWWSWRSLPTETIRWFCDTVCCRAAGRNWDWYKWNTNGKMHSYVWRREREKLHGSRTRLKRTPFIQKEGHYFQLIKFVMLRCLQSCKITAERTQTGSPCAPAHPVRATRGEEQKSTPKGYKRSIKELLYCEPWRGTKERWKGSTDDGPSPLCITEVTPGVGISECLGTCAQNQLS